MGDHLIVPATMKAWIASRPGAARDILSLKINQPTPPAPTAGKIMVRVSYVALNPGDVKLLWEIPFRRNFIPAIDFAGEVVRMGPLVSSSPANIGIGDIVAGTVPGSSIFSGAGTLAEYILVPGDIVTKKPDRLDESVAAGLLGVAGQTNMVLFKSTRELQPGDRVLVNGATGGVGCILVQWLHAVGMHVTATCSTRNLALAMKLGADEVIDYTAHSSVYDHLTSKAAAGNLYDCIIDCVGDDKLYYRSPGYLKPEGKCICIARGPRGFVYSFVFNHWPLVFGGIPRKYMTIMSGPSGSSARQVVEMFEKGWIKEVPVDTVFPMSDAVEAFEKVSLGRTVGKLFVKVRS
ncbi:zinc alcohol dehydrogenase [Xylariaceae sp. FL0255]|nr:zinc alcohol dehydrogenase [Xylariaceae sp. FL0255]